MKLLERYTGLGDHLTCHKGRVRMLLFHMTLGSPKNNRMNPSTVRMSSFKILHFWSSFLSSRSFPLDLLILKSVMLWMVMIYLSPERIESPQTLRNHLVNTLRLPVNHTLLISVVRFSSRIFLVNSRFQWYLSIFPIRFHHLHDTKHFLWSHQGGKIKVKQSKTLISWGQKDL